MKDASGKVVYITGGSSGIGLATARSFASRGAHVVIFARDETRLARACRDIELSRREASQRVAYVSMDVADHGDVSAKVSRAVELHGPPDV
ncbi:MAG TPA: SDR family NAD(P)-dependent oxidoreductase, partial [Deltaproteobacteria bacterium]|nr:SDR family NAD(P)-dependent oxidoreductase [Deltaproteobacteria bacterium]